MATTARGKTKNNIYYIVSRAARQMKIFYSAHDKDTYLSFMVFYAKKHRVHIFAHTIMPNHIHMLVKPLGKNSLPNFMHDLQMRYAKYFNTKYRGQGAVWGGRYRSFLITDEEYFYHVKEYIEANVVKAKLVKKASDWRWSSAYKKVEEVVLFPIKRSMKYTASQVNKSKHIIRQRE